MRRLICHFLVFCMLTSTNVWALAIDSDGAGDGGDPCFLLEQLDTTHHQDSAADPTCNHLCHAGAHLLGTLPTHQSLPFATGSTGVTSRFTSLISRPKDPPTHPPQI